MKVCDKCRIIMISGTHYENGQHNRYTECPNCHIRIDTKRVNNNDISFKDILLKVAR